ncbi:probable methyltransferase-like protein 24 [Scomber scombrus]|uniref:Probable methyltransferase-like protein 24 n=1 Tax=Scomber scombrus TaxID=13677 RepID=A0AAV1NS04_SCOSC
MFTLSRVGGAHLHPWLWDIPPTLVRIVANKAEVNGSLQSLGIRAEALKGESPIFVCRKRTAQLGRETKIKRTPHLLAVHLSTRTERLGVEDRSLERSLARSGCEVHCFDPSLKQPHLQHAEMWLHRLSVDWRDPNPAIVAQRQYASTKKLATILNDFGHRQVDVLKADMESAEWKILENLVLEGVLDSVGQLLLELHLHWAGFEVGGDDPSVVRYWFSLLKELEHANFRLFHVHNDPAKPHLFLHKNVLNASSAYTLSWVNTQWKP